MKFEGFPNKKQQLIKRITDLTGKTAVYSGAPDFSYDIGDYRVLRDGTLLVLDEDAKSDVLNTLINERLLIDPLFPSSVEGMIGGPDALNREPAPEPKETKSYTPSPVTWTFSTAREENCRTYDEPIVIQDRVVSTQTMVNLLNMIYSKGDILNRVVGKPRSFWVSDRVILDLPYEHPQTFKDIARILRVRDEPKLRGIELTPTAVTFTGFPETNDYVVRRAYEKLAEAMYGHAVNTKWISSKQQPIENERYFFRNWINHMGFKGPENKTYRDILMHNLGGNASFRTRDQFIAHKARRADGRKEAEVAV